MNLWQRTDPLAVPYVALLAFIRRAYETARLAYWRQFYGWRIGKGVRVHGSVVIPRSLVVELGDNVVIGQHTRLNAELPGGELKIGKNSKVAQYVILDVTGNLHIQEDVTISEGAILYTHTHGRDPRSPPRRVTVTVGRGSWICARATILHSAKSISEGAIVPACTCIREPFSGS